MLNFGIDIPLNAKFYNRPVPIFLTAINVSDFEALAIIANIYHVQVSSSTL